ncbi:GGDEF domain-containing protein [Actinoplanes friuliensis]|uniref:Putative signaling protein n=1 Tax=Actinoplanes friuliensis DSM 7358 TaxID=1246995 RepID=U5W7B8_9ACTN|nr:GGDEF domain-containing protein [Actinoplanes friuliensis]AGZ43890.1 putative signaling protein [Actinoplanes friuliensis DSM 7358]
MADERASLGRISGAVAGSALLWFAVNAVHPVGPSLLLWLPTLAAGLVLTAALLRTSRVEGLPLPTRLFWRRLSIAAGSASVALAAQAYDVWRNPDSGGAHVTPVLIAGAALAQLFIVYALLRLPLGDRQPGALLRVVLDAGTVMLAAAVFLWHFQTRHLVGAEGFGLIGSLILTVTGMVAVFSVVKVVLSGHRYVDRGSLRLLATAVLVGTLAPALQPYLQESFPHLFATMVGNPACFFVAVLAAERQRRGSSQPGADRDRRPFSLFPYVAVAAVDVLLVQVAFDAGLADDVVVVLAAVVLTALVALRQVTALIDNGELVRRLDHSATHDALTQLPNRVLFHRRLEAALASPSTAPVVVALLDLDGFKQVNDTLGHDAGDRLLIVVARRLGACVREGDTVARLGGDEFVVVMGDAGAEVAEDVARRMLDALAEPVLLGDAEVPIGASIGLAAGHSGADAGELLRRADIAMYAAKAAPGSAVRHFTEELTTADRLVVSRPG